MAIQHKFGTKRSGEEGRLAENWYDRTCDFHKLENTVANAFEDCRGTDRFRKGRKIDIKGRKHELKPHTAWIELSAAGNVIGTGWGFKDKIIAQLMIYQEDGYIIRAVFGEYEAKDLEQLFKSMKIKLDEKTELKGDLYKVYTRRNREGDHRGDLTVITYEDLESLPSFKAVPVPDLLLQEMAEFYQYKGVR